MSDRRRRPNNKRFRVGSTVFIQYRSPYRRSAVVLRHGYGAKGPYTQVRFNDTGEVQDFHRSHLYEDCE